MSKKCNLLGWLEVVNFFNYEIYEVGSLNLSIRANLDCFEYLVSSFKALGKESEWPKAPQGKRAKNLRPKS